MPHFMIKLCAPNDSNGNPRRAWVSFNSDGMALAFYEEDYSGALAISDPEIRSLTLIAPTISVSAKELRTWRGNVANS